jgi:hypothetical protein
VLVVREGAVEDVEPDACEMLKEGKVESYFQDFVISSREVDSIVLSLVGSARESKE